MLTYRCGEVKGEECLGARPGLLLSCSAGLVSFKRKATVDSWKWAGLDARDVALVPEGRQLSFKEKTKNPAVLKMLLCRLQRQAPEIIPPPVALKTRCHASKESAWQPQKSRSERKKRDLHLWSGDQHSSLLRMTTTMARLHLPRPGSPQNLLPDIPS